MWNSRKWRRCPEIDPHSQGRREATSNSTREAAANITRIAREATRNICAARKTAAHAAANTSTEAGATTYSCSIPNTATNRARRPTPRRSR